MRCVPFFLPRCETDGLWGPCFFVLRFYRHSLFGRPSGGRIRFVFRFYRHSLFGRPSGGPLSVLTERGERATKGLQSRPLESGFFIRGFGGETCGLFYVCARVQLTRFRPVRGVWQAHCFHGLDCTAVPSKIVSSTVPLAAQHAEARG